MHAPRPAAPAVIMTRIVAGFALVAGLSACGYKGPLYMPPPPPPDASVVPPQAAPKAPAEAPAATPAAVR